LKNAFLAVINTEPDNERTIARNAERVVTARLRDASFFWDSDRRAGLDSRIERLDTLMFHKKLGSYRQKAERVEELARWIADEALGAPAGAAEQAAQAARLSKADLATDMVREFPELQGLMGGIYARAEGMPEEVWKAIYFHYLPTTVDSAAPPSKAQLGRGAVPWAAVSLADKLDTIMGLHAAGERFSGSRDPYGMRRQAHGVLKILFDLPELTGIERAVPLDALVERAASAFKAFEGAPGAEFQAHGFWQERLAYVAEQRGHAPEHVRSVAATGDLTPLIWRRKLQALPEFVGSPAFDQLATTFKRVKNIARELKGASAIPLDRLAPALREPSEATLLKDLQALMPRVEAAVAKQDFRAALGEVAALGPAVDRVFVDVLVMVDDLDLRRARLSLMAHLRDVVLAIADVSELAREAREPV
jgi:glycyl-tRNA synthetase beta chain